MGIQYNIVDYFMNRDLKHTYRYNNTKLIRSIVSFVMVLFMFIVLPVKLSADDDDITIEDYNGRPIGVLVVTDGENTDKNRFLY